MVFGRQGKFNSSQTLAFGSISASYAKVGVVFPDAVRAFRLINNTDGDMFWALTNGSTPLSDGTQDNEFTPAGSYVLYDIASNAFQNAPIEIPQNTQVWVRQSSAPSKNSVYVTSFSVVNG